MTKILWEIRRHTDIGRIIIALLAVWGMISTVGGCSSPRDDAAKTRKTSGAIGAASAAKTSIPGTVAAGKKLFGALCKGCHGKEGRGDVGPNLTVSTYKYGKSKPEIIKTITGGRPGGMPSFSSQLDGEQIESLAEFVLTLK